MFLFVLDCDDYSTVGDRSVVSSWEVHRALMYTCIGQWFESVVREISGVREIIISCYKLKGGGGIIAYFNILQKSYMK